MNSKLVLKKGREIFSTYKMLEDFKSYNFGEKKNMIDVLNGEEIEISLDGIKIFFGNWTISKQLEFEAKSDFPFLSVSFEFGGDSFYEPKNDAHESIAMSIKKNQYNFFYMPEINGKVGIKGDHRNYFILLFTEEYLKNLFKDSFSEVSSEFGEALADKKPYLMFEESQPIPYRLLTLVDEIKSCCYNKNVKEVYIQSKVMEIFAFLFSELLTKNDIKLKKQDVELMKKSEELIRKNLSSPLTLDELVSRLVTNQAKVKELFYLIHKESVFSFTSRLRMEKAKELLMANNTISEVATAVGYKNPQHFTTAFKKRYNYLPSDLKREFEIVNLKK